MTGWIYFLYDPLIPNLCTLVAAAYVSSTLSALFGINVPWWLYASIVYLGLGAITFIGIKPSIRTSILFTLLEVGITLVFSVFLIGVHGISGNDISKTFTLAGTPKGISGLAFGMIFAVLSYTGFESTIPLAEETKNPRRTVAHAAGDLGGDDHRVLPHLQLRQRRGLGTQPDCCNDQRPGALQHDGELLLGQGRDRAADAGAYEQQLGLLAGGAERGRPRDLQDGPGRRPPEGVRARASDVQDAPRGDHHHDRSQLRSHDRPGPLAGADQRVRAVGDDDQRRNHPGLRAGDDLGPHLLPPRAPATRSTSSSLTSFRSSAQ